ncbi:hypothetical protein C8Q75DRAFT_215207 [Abortiporus biennis]|nr:hypothetical protein C8Q75DRAFT_215207 [Abortiporus biennis]
MNSQPIDILTAQNNPLFTYAGAKNPVSSRKIHIRRLYDILQLCILRGDYVRARRAWSILIRCNEVDWHDLWRTGVVLLGEIKEGNEQETLQKIEYLTTIMLQHKEEVTV